MFINSLMRKSRRALNLAVDGDWRNFISRLNANMRPGSTIGSTADFWDHASNVEGTQWYEIPAVQRRWNELITGKPEVDAISWIAQKYFTQRRPNVIVSLACGSGEWELAWANALKPRRVIGYDIAPERIRQANELVQTYRGSAQFEFQVKDINQLDLGGDKYDIIVAKAGLHHLDQLEYVFDQIANHLTEEGLFIVDEFIGPSRFQWAERQMQIVNSLIDLLPARHRRSLLNPGKDKTPITRLSVSHMLAEDPSEAARSAEIPELLRQKFDILEWRPYGGGVLHLLLSEIAGNFDEGYAEDMALLEILFNIEDYFMLNGDVPSDFLFAVCRPRI